MMKIVINDVKRFKNLFSNVWRVFPQLSLSFTEDGISFREMTEDYITIVSCNIKDIEVVELDEIDVRINTEQLMSVINCIDGGPVTITVDSECLHLSTNMKSFIINTVDYEFGDFLTPAISSDIDVEVFNWAFLDVIEEFDCFGADSISFKSRYDGDVLLLEAFGDSQIGQSLTLSKYNFSLIPDVDYDVSLEVSFNITILRNILKCLNPDDILKVGFANANPIKISVDNEFYTFDVLSANCLECFDENESYWKMLYKLKNMED